jgi:hypothetical protein
MNDRTTSTNSMEPHLPHLPPQDLSIAGSMGKSTEAQAEPANASVGITRGARAFAACVLLAMLALAYVGQFQLQAAQSSGQLPLEGLGLIALVGHVTWV